MGPTVSHLLFYPCVHLAEPQINHPSAHPHCQPDFQLPIHLCTHHGGHNFIYLPITLPTLPVSCMITEPSVHLLTRSAAIAVTYLITTLLAWPSVTYLFTHPACWLDTVSCISITIPLSCTVSHPFLPFRLNCHPPSWSAGLSVSHLLSACLSLLAECSFTCFIPIHPVGCTISHLSYSSSSLPAGLSVNNLLSVFLG